MAIIDIEELKVVLDVGDIYEDATLQQVADSASDIILNLLKFNRYAIRTVQISSNVATFWTLRKHDYVVGQSVILSGLGSPFDGTRTITKVPTVDSFQTALTNADITKRHIFPNGQALLASQTTLYDAVAEVREAALMLAVDIWNARQSASGQAIAVDYNGVPSPYRMGRGLYTRVSGLLAKHRDPAGYIG